MRVFGIVAAALISVALAAPGAGRAGADGDEFGISAAPAAALAPGVAIGTYNVDTTPGVVCTAGWLVTDPAGRPGMLTAAHCDRGGSALFYSAARGFEGIGRFVEHDDTLAVLGIDNVRMTTGTVSAVDSRVIGVRPVTMPADPPGLSLGQQLCAYGTASRLRCGPVTTLTETTVTVATPSAPADTGGPVYYRGNAATPVGVTLSGDSASTTAALIGPWLRRWQLAVDTTDAAASAVRRVDVVAWPTRR